MRPLNLFRVPPRYQRRQRRLRIMTYLAIGMVVLFLLTPFYLIYKPPSKLFDYFESKYPSVLFRFRPSALPKKIIALSFDDAPSAYTTEIAEILKANEAHATFFVIGDQVSGRAGILSDLVKDGHELGNHAMHDEPSKDLASSTLQKQLTQVDHFINDAYTTVGAPRGKYRWFRPGSGFFNQRLIDTADSMGMHIVLGNIYPHDPQISYSSMNARHVLSMAQSGGIIINHDRRPWTAPMLRTVLPKLKQQGFEIVTISRLVSEVEEAGKKGWTGFAD